jgi:hypothetical protein
MPLQVQGQLTPTVAAALTTRILAAAVVAGYLYNGQVDNALLMV